MKFAILLLTAKTTLAATHSWPTNLSEITSEQKQAIIKFDYKDSIKNIDKSKFTLKHIEYKDSKSGSSTQVITYVATTNSGCNEDIKETSSINIYLKNDKIQLSSLNTTDSCHID